MTTGKRCIVLGGSGVVGRALVRELTEAGARVGFSYLSGESVARELGETCPGVSGLRIDLADPVATEAGVVRLAGVLGGVDALIHCAVKTSTCDPAKFDAIEEVDLGEWDRLMAINVKSAFVAARSLLPHFGAEGGNVLLFGSVDGIKPVPTPVPYAASKAAGRGLVLSLAKALGKHRICVNMVAPGVLEAGASRTLPDDLRAEYLRHAGLRRVGKVSEVTGLATWLALENTYVTGQVILVDGGL
jgi:3-oxoacyl-[acyl-carrier protein] reductase